MGERTVSGVIYHPVTNLPWSAAAVAFELQETFVAGGTTYPAETVTVLTDGTGVFTVDLATPDSGAAIYRVRVSNLVFDVALATGAALTLAELIALEGVTASAPDALQTAVAAVLAPLLLRLDALEALEGLLLE